MPRLRPGVTTDRSDECRMVVVAARADYGRLAADFLAAGFFAAGACAGAIFLDVSGAIMCFAVSAIIFDVSDIIIMCDVSGVWL